MSAALLARQQLVPCAHAIATLRAINVGRACITSTARQISTQPQQQRGGPAAASKRAWPLKTLGGGLVAAGGGWMYLGSSNEGRTFSIHAPLESEGSGNTEKQVTGSSTLLRPAAPTAPRRQTVTLVFVTSHSTGKGLVQRLASNFGSSSHQTETWFPWIGYFREAGYDCLQMNLALAPEEATNADTKSHAGLDATTSRLADELHTQLRLSNLQRQPVLFVHHSADSSPTSIAQVVSEYIEPHTDSQNSSTGSGWLSNIFGGGGMFGSRPAISGLVVVSDLDDASAMTLFGKHPKLNTLIVANAGAHTHAHQGKVSVLDAQGQSHDKLIKAIERWLIKQGYEG